MYTPTCDEIKIKIHTQLASDLEFSNFIDLNIYQADTMHNQYQQSIMYKALEGRQGLFGMFSTLHSYYTAFEKMTHEHQIDLKLLEKNKRGKLLSNEILKQDSRYKLICSQYKEKIDKLCQSIRQFHEKKIVGLLSGLEHEVNASAAQMGLNDWFRMETWTVGPHNKCFSTWLKDNFHLAEPPTFQSPEFTKENLVLYFEQSGISFSSYRTFLMNQIHQNGIGGIDTYLKLLALEYAKFCIIFGDNSHVTAKQITLPGSATQVLQIEKMTELYIGPIGTASVQDAARFSPFVLKFKLLWEVSFESYTIVYRQCRVDIELIANQSWSENYDFLVHDIIRLIECLIDYAPCLDKLEKIIGDGEIECKQLGARLALKTQIPFQYSPRPITPVLPQRIPRDRRICSWPMMTDQAYPPAWLPHQEYRSEELLYIKSKLSKNLKLPLINQVCQPLLQRRDVTLLIEDIEDFYALKFFMQKILAQIKKNVTNDLSQNTMLPADYIYVFPANHIPLDVAATEIKELLDHVIKVCNEQKHFLMGESEC